MVAAHPQPPEQEPDLEDGQNCFLIRKRVADSTAKKTRMGSIFGCMLRESGRRLAPLVPTEPAASLVDNQRGEISEGCHVSELE